MAVTQTVSTEDLSWTFGDRVRKVRRRAGLTQRAFAARLQVTPASVDAWEAERNKPRDLQRMATRIELAFGLPRGWMLGYAEQSGPDDRGITLWSRRPSRAFPDGHVAPVVPIRPGLARVAGLGMNPAAMG